MSAPPRPAADVPPHVEETIVAIAEMHAEHRRQSHKLQRALAAIISALGRPGFLVVLTCLLAAWLGANTALHAAGHAAPDPPPFAYLATISSVVALCLAAIILVTQKHEDELAAHRDQLTLQLAIHADRKSAKIIRLLEEFRRNDPAQSDDADSEAEAMAVPADPKAVLDKIRVTHTEGAK